MAIIWGLRHTCDARKTRSIFDDNVLFPSLLKFVCVRSRENITLTPAENGTTIRTS